MRFVEVDLFGVYVAPVMPMMVAAWFVTVGLRWAAARRRALRHVWHPALFVLAVYVVVLWCVMFAATGGDLDVPG